MTVLPSLGLSSIAPEKLDEMTTEADSDGNTALRSSIISTIGADREKAGKASVIGRELGVPADMAERNLEQLERQRKIESMDFDALEKDHPLLSEYMMEPNNAKLFSDDLSFWTRASDVFVRSPTAGGVQGVGMTVAGTGRAVQDVGNMGGETAAASEDFSTKAARARQSGKLNWAQNFAMSMDEGVLNAMGYLGLAAQATATPIGEATKNTGKAIKKAGESIRTPEDRRGVADDLGEGVGQIIAQIAASMAGGPAANIGMMAGQGLEMGYESAERNKATGTKATFGAIEYAAATAITEKYGLEAVMKGIPAPARTKIIDSIGRFAQRLGLSPEGMMAAVAHKASDTAFRAGSEAVQEASEGGLQNAVDKYLFGENKDVTEGLGYQAFIGGGVGGIVGGIFSVLTGHKLRTQHEHLQDRIDALKTLSGDAKNSESLKRDPVKFQELMSYLNDNQQEVWVTPDAALQFFQDGSDPSDLLKIAPDIAAKLNEAAISGADVAIPVDRLIGLTAQTDEYDFIYDHLRVTENGPTLKESQATQEDGMTEERVRQIIEEEQALQDQETEQAGQASDADLVEKKFYDQLVNTGRETAYTAKNLAALQRSTFETLMTRSASNPVLQAKIKERFMGLEAQADSAVPRYRPTQFDATIDRARKGGKARARTPRAPVMGFVRKLGGIKRNSPMAAELRTMDITPRSHPRIFNPKGRDSLDNIPAAEFNAQMADRNLIAKEDGQGYVDQDWLLEEIRRENSGEVALTENEKKQDEEDAYLDDLIRVIDEAGVDLHKATNQEIREALLKLEESYKGRTFNQAAYHGSPHKFDKFTLDHIGTGEGAQAYGWGLYFAGNKEVAEYYREQSAPMPETMNLRVGGVQVYSNGKPTNLPTNTGAEQARALLAEQIMVEERNILYEMGQRDTPEKAQAYAKKRIGAMIDQFIVNYTDDVPEYVEELKIIKNKFETSSVGFVFKVKVEKGQLYEVQIPDDDVLILWDKPLSKQSKFVRDKLREAGFDTDEKAMAEYDNALLAALTKDGDTNLPKQPQDPTGEQIYEQLKRDTLFKNEISAKAFGDERASKYLNSLGIKGVKYLDGHSRSKGEGHYNYVIFDDEAINVLNTFYAGDSIAPRGSITFTGDGRSIMRLMETSNRATVLHEMAHFFLDVMQGVFTDPSAPQQMRDDWAGTLKWVTDNANTVAKEANGYDQSITILPEHVTAYIEKGTAGDERRDKAILTAMHEQFARGFEAFLFEGKAPSQEVRGIFEIFSSWIQRVYKYAVENLRVNVSPEIKAVFERLIATDEQIDSYKNQAGFRPDPQTLEMLTAKQQEDYIKLNDRRLAAAKQKLFRKAMRQHERAQTAWYKEERAKVREEQKAIAQDSPLYQAVRFFKTGKDAAGNVLMEEGHKLNKKAIKARFGEEVIKYLPKGVTSSKGIDPEIAADMFGYESADRMIHAMTGMETEKAAIERMTDTEMIARYGDMLVDGTLEREALEAMMDQPPTPQMMELQALSTKTGFEYPTDGDFQRAAREMLAGQKVDESIKPARYYRAVVRAAREYGKYMAKKDYVKAAAAKRREILNHHLFAQSAKARENVEDALEKFGKLQKKPKKNKPLKMDADYRDQIISLLQSVNLAPRMSKAREMRLELAAISAWIEAKQKDENAQLIMPPELQTAEGLQHYREMKLGEFMAFRDLVFNIAKQGRKKMQLLVEGKKRVLAEDGAAAADIVYDNNKTRPHAVNPKDHGLGRYLIGITEKAESLIEKLDGGKTMGFIWQRLRGGIFQGELKEQQLQAEAALKMRGIIERHYGGKKINNYTVSAEDITSKKSAVFINAKVGSLTTAERISVLLNMGNADNRTKLLDGSKGLSPTRQEWDDSDLDAITMSLREKDLQFAQDVWDLLDEYWPAVRDLQRERLGYAPEKVEAEPLDLVTIDGKNVSLRGGYYRLKYNGRLLAKSNGYEMQDMANMMAQGALASTQTKRGSTMERKSGVKQPILLNLSVIDMHLNEVIHDLALGEAVREANKFLHQPDFAQSVIDTQGMEGMEALELWLGDIAAGGLSPSSRTDKMFQNLRHSATMGALMLKYSTIVQQLTGFSNSIVELRPKYAAIGLARYTKLGGPLGAGSRVAEKSAYMASRPAIINRDVSMSLRKLERTGMWSDAQSAALVPMLRLQYVVDTVTWLGAYEKGIDQGKRDGLDGDKLDKHAIKFADLAVERSQGSSFISSLSATERGTTGKKTRLQEAIKTWTMFMSYFNAKINVALRRTRATNFSDPASVLSLAGDYMILFWVEYILGEAILGRWPDFENDKDDSPLMAFFKWSFGGAASTAAAGVPFLRDAAGAMEGFGGGPAAGRGLGQIGQGAGYLAKQAGKAAHGEFGELNPYKIAKAGVTLGNYASPIKYPAGQINLFLDALDRAGKGEDVAPLDYLRYNPNN